MKKLITYTALAALAYLLTSCSNEVVVREAETGEIWSEVVTFYYKGHQYIKFTNIEAVPRCGVVHDPDCPCIAQ